MRVEYALVRPMSIFGTLRQWHSICGLDYTKVYKWPSHMTFPPCMIFHDPYPNPIGGGLLMHNLTPQF